jgi:hypothetical protein
MKAKVKAKKGAISSSDFLGWELPQKGTKGA